jgi:hypothetical protein
MHGSRYLRSNAPTHRFSSDYETVTFEFVVIVGGPDYGTAAGLESRIGIRRAPALLGAEKVEGHCIEAARG